MAYDKNTYAYEAHHKFPAVDHAANSAITIIPVTGLPEFTPQCDLAQLITRNVTLLDGDIVVVTSKVISKIEGRTVAAPSGASQREQFKRQLIMDEAVRIVAQTEKTTITENHLGIVQAASGVDSSNVHSDQFILLPKDPDLSARLLKNAIVKITGVNIAVIITDTMGRAWRKGQTDVAIGAAGISSSYSYIGRCDSYGNPLIVTDIAIIDEISAAADLVKGKTTHTPVAIVRGYPFIENASATARDLIRESQEDLFPLGAAESRKIGHQEAILLRKSVREFSDEPVSKTLLEYAIAQALTAPAPHHSSPIVFIHLQNLRTALFDALGEEWKRDLIRDNFTAEQIDKRVSRGNILRTAPEVVIPFLTMEGAHAYSDQHRNNSEKMMFTIAGGAAVASLLIALASYDLASCWIGSTIFSPRITQQILDIPESWIPLGAVAIGYPVVKNSVRKAADISHSWITK